MNIAPIQKEFAIMAAAGEGGSITPCGTVKVERGMSQTFVIQPEEGYVISDVLVNGQSVGAVAEYTFCDVNADAILQHSSRKQLFLQINHSLQLL